MIRSFKPIPFAAALVASLFVSCAGNKSVALSAQDRAAMQGKTLIVSKREMPGFAVITPGKAVTAGLTGPIGGAAVGLAAAKEGQSLLQRHRVSAPEAAVAPVLAKQLASRSGVRVVPANGILTGADPKSISNTYPQADYVLDVFTTAWMGSYYPMTLNKYFIMHGTKMRLVERATGRVVAEGSNFYQGQDKEHAPDYDGMFANDAAFLKAETKKSTDGATSKFSGLL
jgi:hypothetical protein